MQDPQPADPSFGADPAASLPAAGWAPEELRSVDVGELLVQLDKTIRARRFYQANGPVYEGFVAALRGTFEGLWARADALVIAVEEGAFVWHDARFSPGEGRETLAFLFYKDGIRQLVFLPGFEEEVEQFVRVVDEARRVGRDSGDDLVTLLWEQEFSAFQYGYVDVLAEGIEVPGPPEPPAGRLDVERLAAEVRGGDASAVPPAVAAGEPTVAQLVTAQDFAETLYFLDDSELAQLRRDVEREEARDFKTAVLDALFDRLEDGLPLWRLEILRIFRQLLPVYLGRGDLGSAARIVTGVAAVADAGADGDAAEEEVVTEARTLLAELGAETVLNQLLLALEEGSIEPESGDLGVFLEHLGEDSLPRLIHAAETTRVKALQERLRRAIEGLAAAHPQRLLDCIAGDSTVVAVGAARLAGRARLAAAVPSVMRLAGSADATVRLAAADALLELGGPQALGAVVKLLDDADREVRVVAARGIANARYLPARTPLQDVVTGRDLRDADLSERIAFFEAFGAVCDDRGVELLDGLLNGRKLLGRQSPEARACAAVALGRAATAAAREALERAARDPHPVVRNAVTNALRGTAR